LLTPHRFVSPLLITVSHIICPPLTSTLFPYTTLFRSRRRGRSHERALPGRAHHRPGAGLGPHPGLPRRPVQRSRAAPAAPWQGRSEEHTSELQSLTNIVCRLLLE